MLSVLRPSHRNRASEAEGSSADMSNTQQASQDLELGLQPAGSGSRRNGRRANNMTDLSTASTAAPGGGDVGDAEEEAGGAGPSRHGREASGRSIRSALSGISFRNMRERDRQHTLTRVEASVERQRQQQEQAEATTGAAPAPVDGAAAEAQQQQPAPAAADQAGGRQNARSQANDWMLALAAGLPRRVFATNPNGPTPNGPRPATAAQMRSAEKKKANATKKERDEAATLFGPTLSNYFGSGSSSSGAVNGGSISAALNINSVAAVGLTPAADNGQPLSSPSLAAPGALSAQAARRPRLGSRGRARGASLSGLSMQSLNEQYLLQGQTSLPASPNPLFGDPETPGIRESPQEAQLSMADGIEIDTLARWVDRTVGLHTSADGGDDAATAVKSIATSTPSPAGVDGLESTPEPVICTTLQAFVNLKRNAIRLTTVEKAEAAEIKPSPIVGNDPLSITTSNVPPATHVMQFEYDCAAPNASVQIFLRASRKHGSWPNTAEELQQLQAQQQQQRGPAEQAGPKYFAQRGPPPHVLGFPVHGSIIKRGFGSKFKANLALRLDLFAPPGGKTKKDTAVAPAVPPTPSMTGDVNSVNDAVPETPAPPHLDGGSALTPVATHEVADGASAAQPDAAEQDEAAQAAGADQTPEGATTPVLPLTPAEKAAREKLERETLKMAIVVEALDEDNLPLRDPNLQTTYLRVSSLPIRGPDGNPLPNGERTWTVQVEGQEAEIGPHRFQLQELYGLSSKPPPVQVHMQEQTEQGEDGAGANAGDTAQGTEEAPMPMITDLDQSSGSECLICLSDPPTTLLLPCTHGLCLQCAIQLRESVKGIRESERRRGKNPKRKYACPVCRRVYTSMLHISTADEKQVAQDAMRA